MVRKYIYLFLGLLIYAIAYNLFMLPNDFVIGGVSGISIILYRMFNIETDISIFILSFILLIFAFIFCDRSKALSSVASTFLLPFFIKLTSNIGNIFTFDISYLTSALYSSILVGIALGLIYRVGLSTGGTDIIYWMIEKYLKRSTGFIMKLVEGIIIFAGFLVFGFEKLMYSLIILYIMSYISDYIIMGISRYKLMYLVTKREKEVLSFLDNFGVKVIKLRVGRKYTYICLVSNNNYFTIYKSLLDIDKDIFISVNNTYQVEGLE